MVVSVSLDFIEFTYETPCVVSTGIAQFTYETPNVVSTGIAQPTLVFTSNPFGVNTHRIRIGNYRQQFRTHKHARIIQQIVFPVVFLNRFKQPDFAGKYQFCYIDISTFVFMNGLELNGFRNRPFFIGLIQELI
jgi:hypothetical protein